jgi:PAS domain-containing protein
LPDLIIITNNVGRVIQFNTAFESLYKHTEQELSTGVFISSIFFKLYQQNPDWYKQPTNGMIDTTMETREGEITVKAMTRNLAVADTAAMPQNDLVSKLSSNEEPHEESEDYVIIARLVVNEPKQE